MYLVTIDSVICRDTQMLQVFDKKFINEDDAAILEEEAEETKIGRGVKKVDWRDVLCDVVVKEYLSSCLTKPEIVKEISEKYGINPYFINVYTIKYEGKNKDNN